MDMKQDSTERFLKLAGHIRVNGRQIKPMPPAITPEAEALRKARLAPPSSSPLSR